jgi:hypothetical protein
MRYSNSTIRSGLYYREHPDNIDFKLICLVYTKRHIHIFFDLIFTDSYRICSYMVLVVTNDQSKL